AQRDIDDRDIDQRHQRRRHHGDRDRGLGALNRGLHVVAAQRVWITTSTLMPGKRTWPCRSSILIFTGTRCVTLMKLPVAFSGGSSETRAPVPAATLSTWPSSLPENVSISTSAGCPGAISASWVSLKLATTQMSLRSTIAMSARSGDTSWPGSTVRLLTVPGISEPTMVYVSSTRR